MSRVRNTRDLTDLMEEHCDYIVRNWGLYVVRGAGCAARGRSLDCACVQGGDITRGGSDIMPGRPLRLANALAMVDRIFLLVKPLVDVKRRRTFKS